MNKDNKSIAKDIGILLSIFGPLLFVLIGGSMWLSGSFVGTLMEELFPALFLGLVTAYAAIITAGNLFPEHPIIRWISGITLGATVAVLNVCQADTASMVVMGACGVAACIIVLVRWINQ